MRAIATGKKFSSKNACASPAVVGRKDAARRHTCQSAVWIGRPSCGSRLARNGVQLFRNAENEAI